MPARWMVSALVLCCSCNGTSSSPDASSPDAPPPDVRFRDGGARDAPPDGPADGLAPDRERDLPVTGDSAPGDDAALPLTNTVLFQDGEALLVVDGQPHRPIFLGLNSISMTDQKWRDFEYQVTLARQAGTPVALVAMGWDSVVDAAGRKVLFDRLEQLDVKVIVRFSLNALTTMLVAYGTGAKPLEDMLYENLAGQRERMLIHRTCDPADPTCTNPNPLYLPAFDANWVDDIWVQIEALLTELDRDYPGRVVGLQLAHLNGGEWFLRWDSHVYPLPGSAEDPYYCCYEPGITAAFCAYLAGQAPGLSCAVPSAATRDTGTFGAVILDDSTDDSRRAVLFNRFISQRVAQAISELAARAKALTAGRLLVNAFYGYLFEHNRGLSHLTSSGHLALRTLLEDPNIDSLSGPYSYGPARALGVAFEPHGPVDSMRLHDKLWIHEDDSRTHLAAVGQRSVATLAGSQNLAQRNLLTALLHQNGSYFFDLWTGGWFGRDLDAQTRADSEALWDAIAGGVATFDHLDVSGPRAIEPQVALFVDELSAARHPIGVAAHRAYLEGIYRDPVVHGSRVMAPVRYYRLSDLALPSFPAESIRLAIFANAFDVSPALRQTIAAKLHTGGKVLLYVHAAGALRGGGVASAAHVSELIGFEVSRGAGARVTTSTFSDSAWDWLPAAPFGLSAPLDPWFYVPAGQSGVISVARDADQQITVARKNFGTHRVLYAATPGAPRDLYRTAAAWAGVAQLSDDIHDVVDGHGNLLMLHAGEAGTRTVKLPFTTPHLYLQIEAGAPLATPRLLCASCDSVAIDAPEAGSTYLLRWE